MDYEIDYSSVPEVDMSLVKKFVNKLGCSNENIFNNYFIDIQLIKNEKIVIFHVYKECDNKYTSLSDIFINDIKYYCFIMSNYGRMISNCYTDKESDKYTIKQYNTWIPIDYIININLINPKPFDFDKTKPKGLRSIKDIIARCEEIKFENINNNFFKLNEKIENLYKIIKEKDSIICKLESEKKSILSIKNDLFDLKSNKVIQKKVPINEFDISDDEQ
jgi:hypothetical protein